MAIKTVKSMMSTEVSVDFECERSLPFSLKGSLENVRPLKELERMIVSLHCRSDKLVVARYFTYHN